MIKTVISTHMQEITTTQPRTRLADPLLVLVVYGEDSRGLPASFAHLVALPSPHVVPRSEAPPTAILPFLIARPASTPPTPARFPTNEARAARTSLQRAASRLSARRGFVRRNAHLESCDGHIVQLEQRARQSERAPPSAAAAAWEDSRATTHCRITSTFLFSSNSSCKWDYMLCADRGKAGAGFWGGAVRFAIWRCSALHENMFTLRGDARPLMRYASRWLAAGRSNTHPSVSEQQQSH